MTLVSPAAVWRHEKLALFILTVKTQEQAQYLLPRDVELL